MYLNFSAELDFLEDKGVSYKHKIAGIRTCYAKMKSLYEKSLHSKTVLKSIV